MLNTAVTKYSSTNANDKSLAEEVLDSPMSAYRTMEALVATNNSVSNAVTISSNDTVNTEAVTDEMITQAVNVYWASVARRRAERLATAAAANAATP
jgi:hypothetical protein